MPYIINFAAKNSVSKLTTYAPPSFAYPLVFPQSEFDIPYSEYSGGSEVTVSPISLPLVPPFIVQKTLFPGQQISLNADLTKVDLLTYFPVNVMAQVSYDWAFQLFDGSQCANNCGSTDTFDVTIGINGGTPTSYSSVDCFTVFKSFQFFSFFCKTRVKNDLLNKLFSFIFTNSSGSSNFPKRFRWSFFNSDHHQEFERCIIRTLLAPCSNRRICRN